MIVVTIVTFVGLIMIIADAGTVTVIVIIASMVITAVGCGVTLLL